MGNGSRGFVVFGLLTLVTIVGERVASAFPVDTSHYYEANASYVKTGNYSQNLSVVAHCNAGDTVMTGICYSTNGADGYITEFGDNNPSAYVCNWLAAATTGSITFYAQALCVHP